MKQALLAVLFVFPFNPLIFAQDKTARPDIDELLGLMRVQKTSESTMQQMKSMMAGIAKRNNVAPEIAEKTKAMQDKMFALVEDEMSWDRMKTEYATVYGEVFTPEEVKGLIAFYKTPVGQTFLDKQPLLTQKLMEMVQKRMMELMPKIKEMVQQEGNAAGATKPEPSAEKH